MALGETLILILLVALVSLLHAQDAHSDNTRPPSSHPESESVPAPRSTPTQDAVPVSVLHDTGSNAGPTPQEAQDAIQHCVHTGSVYNCSGLTLHVIPPDIPTHCTVLDLGGNRLTTLPRTLLLQDLVTLSLHDNHISSVDHVLFNNQFPHLVELDLSGNMLSSLPGHLPGALQKLDVDRNTLTGVDVTGLDKLEEVYLQYNMVSGSVSVCSVLRAGGECRSKLPLKTLALSHNNIDHLVDDGLTGLESLRVLSLKNNNIKTLKKDTFRGAPSLTLLDLSDNEISVIDGEAFKDLHSLQYLYLSKNRLGVVPGGLPLLEWLDVSYNKIRTINETLKTTLYPIEMVNLGHNPWHCDCHLVWVKEWWDRREYILQYSDTISHDDYVPSCASPPPLAGERWTMLADDVFTCSQEDRDTNHGHGHVPSKVPIPDDDNDRVSTRVPIPDDDNDHVTTRVPIPDDQYHVAPSIPISEYDQDLDPFLVPGENPKYIQAYGLHVQVRAVQTTSVTLEWHAPPHHTNLIIQYFIHTAEVETTLFSQVQAAQGHFVLRNLEADSDYTICVMPKSETLSLSAPLDDCIRVRTQRDMAAQPRGLLEGILSFRMDHTMESKFKLILGCFCVSVVIVASGLLLAEGVLRLCPQSADKEHDD